MKYLVIILSFLFVQSVSAAIIVVPSASAVPSGYSLGADGLYSNSDDSINKYRVDAGGSNPISNAATSSNNDRPSGAGPNTSDDKNITNGLVTNQQLKDGNVDMYTIPIAIAGMIQFLLGVAGTISVVALIYHAVQMQINSGITGDSSGVDKAKKGIFGALVGFAIALLAWFLVTNVVQILTNVT